MRDLLCMYIIIYIYIHIYICVYMYIYIIIYIYISAISLGCLHKKNQINRKRKRYD